jgi:rhodanese-related sulfurtransferase
MAVKLGYKKVKVFAAGYPAWQKFAGEGATASAVPIKKGADEGSIDLEEFKKILAERPESIYLVDVRDAEDYSMGHFKSAVNISTDDLEKNISQLPSDKPVVFVCSTGARSGEAYYMVQDLRPELKEVYYLEATATYNEDGTYSIKKSE